MRDGAAPCRTKRQGVHFMIYKETYPMRTRMISILLAISMLFSDDVV